MTAAATGTSSTTCRSASTTTLVSTSGIRIGSTVARKTTAPGAFRAGPSNLVGIMNSDVVNIAYGDGFYTQPDPTDPRYVYANSQSGRTYLVDLETKEERGIRPVPADPKEAYRFNWSTPMLVSPHDPKVVYYGGNKAVPDRRSRRDLDRGEPRPDAQPRVEEAAGARTGAQSPTRCRATMASATTARLRRWTNRRDRPGSSTSARTTARCR